MALPGAAGVAPETTSTSDGGPAEATDPPVDAAPGTRGAPYMPAPTPALILLLLCCYYTLWHCDLQIVTYGAVI
jgi:hypothetical protein